MSLPSIRGDVGCTVAVLRAEVDRRLDAVVPPTESRLGAAMRYALLGAGKRLRPLMVIGAALAVSERSACDDRVVFEISDAVWDGALAMECMHAYSLVHDDLPGMDNDDLRRGAPTVHRAFDEALAILAGDALQSLAFECLSGKRDPGDRTGEGPDRARTRVRCLRELALAAGAQGMAEGQALDLARGDRTDLRSVRHMHALKTGALFRACVRIGSDLAGAEARALTSLTEFGEAFGRMYQALDDLKDASQDTGPSMVHALGIEKTREDAMASREQALGALRPFAERAALLRELVGSVDPYP